MAGAFKLRQVQIDTLGEHVVFVHEAAIETGELGFKPLDRVLVVGRDPATGERREVVGVLNFCRDALVGTDEIGLSVSGYADLALPEGTGVDATIAPAPASVDLVRAKAHGRRLDLDAFQAVLTDVVDHRYSKLELALFVLSCSMQRLDRQETVDLTRAMVATGSRLDLGAGPIPGKHCIGGVPGNRTTMVVVPILAALGLTVPKTSSRAITSPAGTADTMGVLAEVALPPDRLYRVVEEAGACIAWGGSLGLAPADDVLITVERPLEIDTEPQMVASILAKQVTAGVTHVLIDIPLGPTAKVRTATDAAGLAELFRTVAGEVGIDIDVVVTDASGPVGRGIGPRLEALDVLAVLGREPGAPVDLREKALYLAARALEMIGAVPPGAGYRRALEALDSGAAATAFDRIVDAQGRLPMPSPARRCATVPAPADGRIRELDCWRLARVAKLAGAPANPAAGVRLLRTVGDVVAEGDPLLEIHAETGTRLDFALRYAASEPLARFGF